MWARANGPAMQKIDENLTNVTARVQHAAHQAGRNPNEIRLVAVSKTHPAGVVAQAWRHGQRCFGESYLQEALAKQSQLGPLEGLEWHFIGDRKSTRLNSSHVASSYAVFCL